MKKALLLFVLILQFSASEAQIPPAYNGAIQYVLDSLCAKRNIKGVSAAVLIPGMGVWKGTHGVSYGNVPLTTDMFLPIGSNTKTFTASIMLKLQENGQLSLDDTIGKWLHNINNVSGQITIRQMLNHTSGLYNYTNNPAFSVALNSDYTHLYQPEDMLPFIDTPDFAPGTSWAYSNTNFLLAGLIIKQILGEPFNASVRNMILTPRNLQNTVTFPAETPSATVPHGWSVNGSGTTLEDIQATYNWDNTAFLSMATSAGAIESTAEDNVHFWDDLMTGKIINSASLQEMMTTVNIGNGAGYGLGIFRYNSVNGHTGYCHGGTCFGYINENFRDSVNGICITLLSNQDSINNNQLFNWVLVPLHKYLLKLPPAGIIDVNSMPAVSIYPNPASDMMHVQTDVAATVELYDMTGKPVMNRAIAKGDTELSLSAMATGLYIARISHDGTVLHTQRVQVVR